MLDQMTRKARDVARALANQWEFLVGGVEYPTRRFAVNCAHALATAYLRAQAVKLGGNLTLEKLHSNGIIVLTMVETWCSGVRPSIPSYSGWVSTLRTPQAK